MKPQPPSVALHPTPCAFELAHACGCSSVCDCVAAAVPVQALEEVGRAKRGLKSVGAIVEAAISS